MLTTLIRDAFSDPEDSKKDSEDMTSVSSQVVQSSSGSSQTPTGGVSSLSNTRPAVSLLDSLLADDSSTDSSTDSDDVYKTKVDVSLRTPGSGPPSILLLFLPEVGAPTITMNIEIGPNGRINIPDTSGIWESVHGQAQGRPKAEEVERLHRKLAKALETSEDLGTFIEWTLRWIQKRK